MDELLRSLIIPHEGTSVPAYTSLGKTKTAMANAAVARSVQSPHGTQAEPIDLMLEENPSQSMPQPLAQARSLQQQVTSQSSHGLLQSEKVRSTSQYGNAIPLADWALENPYEPKQQAPVKHESKPTGDYSTKFHLLCDSKGLRPIFTYNEVAKGYFTVKVQIDAHAIEDQGPYPSKRQAKESICKRAVADLPEPSTVSAGLNDEQDWVAVLNGE